MSGRVSGGSGAEGQRSTRIDLEPGLLQILDRLALRLLHGVGRGLLLGGHALDRLVDLVADLGNTGTVR
jgi:hypothetical protein